MHLKLDAVKKGAYHYLHSLTDTIHLQHTHTKKPLTYMQNTYM